MVVVMVVVVDPSAATDCMTTIAASPNVLETLKLLFLIFAVELKIEFLTVLLLLSSTNIYEVASGAVGTFWTVPTEVLESWSARALPDRPIDGELRAATLSAGRRIPSISCAIWTGTALARGAGKEVVRAEVVFGHVISGALGWKHRAIDRGARRRRDSGG